MIHHKQKWSPMTVETVCECDRCHTEYSTDTAVGDMEAQEFLHMDAIGGYSSVFGDGQHILLDLCQDCVRDVLGEWIRLEE